MTTIAAAFSAPSLVVVVFVSSAGHQGGGRDIWRSSALRYAGYANEVGESFRFIAPKLVGPSCECLPFFVTAEVRQYGDAVREQYDRLIEGSRLIHSTL